MLVAFNWKGIQLCHFTLLRSCLASSGTNHSVYDSSQRTAAGWLSMDSFRRAHFFSHHKISLHFSFSLDLDKTTRLQSITSFWQNLFLKKGKIYAFVTRLCKSSSFAIAEVVVLLRKYQTEITFPHSQLFKIKIQPERRRAWLEFDPFDQLSPCVRLR